MHLLVCVCLVYVMKTAEIMNKKQNFCDMQIEVFMSWEIFQNVFV